MDSLATEMVLIAVIVFVSYLLPATLFLFHSRDRARLQKATTIEEFGKSIGFVRRRSNLSVQEISDELVGIEKRTKKLLQIFFVIGAPSTGLFVYTILIKHMVNYYIKQKFNYDLPPTKITTYTLTIVMLSVWSSIVLLSNLMIRRVNDLLDKLRSLSEN